MSKKKLVDQDLERIVQRTARKGVRPGAVHVEHVTLLDSEVLGKVRAHVSAQAVGDHDRANALLVQVHHLIHAGLVAARAEGFREAARMVAAKSDLLRGTRGGVPRACTELDLTVRDLMEAAARSGT